MGRSHKLKVEINFLPLFPFPSTITVLLNRKRSF